MKVLNVRLTDEEHADLKRRAGAAGQSVSWLVKDWISTLGQAVVSGPAPAEPQYVAVTDSPPVAVESPAKTPAEAPKPPFLAAPIDTCPACGHDRQESDHLGGRPCKFKLSQRRFCGCTFEGF